MHDPKNSPETLVSVPNDLEAAMIVSALAAHDIDATTSGSYTAGFRAEAPGDVDVLVRRCDLAGAKQVLEELPAPNRVISSSPAKSPIAPASLVKILVLILLSVGILQSCF